MAVDLNVVHGSLECCDTLVFVIYCGGNPRSRIDGGSHATLEEDPEELVIFYALCILGIPQMGIVRVSLYSPPSEIVSLLHIHS